MFFSQNKDVLKTKLKTISDLMKAGNLPHSIAEKDNTDSDADINSDSASSFETESSLMPKPIKKRKKKKEVPAYLKKFTEEVLILLDKYKGKTAMHLPAI